MIHQVIQKYKDMKGLEEGAVHAADLEDWASAPGSRWNYRNKVAKLKLAEAIFKREYHKLVDALGGDGASPGRSVRTAAHWPSVL